MKLSNVIRPGDKIDIKLIHQMNREENGGEQAALYQSRVCDQTSETDLEIEMPISGGKMILFPMGAECHFVFYTKGGMYQCDGRVQKRYKEGNLYFLSVRITTAPEKFQRREFFRIDYVVPLQYYEITEEMAKLETTEEIIAALGGGEEEQKPYKGMIQDISGGGVRFSAKRLPQRGDYLLLSFHLKNERLDEVFYLVSQVVAVQEHPTVRNMYIQRVKFIFRDLKIRERIVRFVFEEERKLRRKEVG
ncbi:MAG: flagellar brake protein [Agathobacter sp.]